MSLRRKETFYDLHVVVEQDEWESTIKKQNKKRTAELALVDVSFDSVCILTSFSAMSMLVSP